MDAAALRARVLRYGVAVLAFAGALLLRLAADPVLGDRQPFLTFYVATALAAWLAGAGPASIAMAAGFVAGEWFFLAPRHTLPVVHPTTPDVVGGAFYFLVGSVLIALTRAARRAEAREQAIVANMGEGVCTVDTEGRVTSINPAAERLFGWSRSEICGRNIHDVTHYRRRDGTPFPASECPSLAVVRTGVPITGQEDWFIRRDGTFFPVTYSTSRLVSGGEVVGLVVVFRDATVRKRIEAEREELLVAAERARADAERTAELLRHIQAITDVGLGDLPPDALMNELLARVRQAVGSDTAVILLADDESRLLRLRASVGLEPDIDQRVEVAVGRGFAGRIAVTRAPVVVPDVDYGEIVSPYIREKGIRALAGVPLLVDERLIGVLHVGSRDADRFGDRDVRLLELAAERIAVAIERATAREAERHARETAEAANRAKDVFLATVSHELRTPLSPIMTWTRILRDRTLDETRVRRALDTIDRCARAQAQLVEDLLDVSRIISGKMPLDPRPTALVPVVERAVEAVRPAADAKGVSLRTELEPRPASVLGDPERLQQVLWNLVANAIKFTPRDGRVVVSLAHAGSHVEIAVADTGQGIAPEFMPHLFERFRQADMTTTRAHGGLGLGLAIVRHIVEAHGGTVYAESAGVGRGAVFTVRLPLVAPRTAADADRRGRGDDGYPSLEGLRILVVDDEEDSNAAVSELLGQCGARVEVATSAARARELLAGTRIDLLVSDVGMPGEDGYGLIAGVRSGAGELADVPAIALTAYASRDDRVRLLAAGFQAHVPKPVDPEELVAVVASVARTAGKL
jgi:PAS domain S-box-containing protein